MGEFEPPHSPETTIRTILVSLIGATVVAAGVLVVRSHKDAEPTSVRVEVPPGETVPAKISLERIRRAGI